MLRTSKVAPAPARSATSNRLLASLTSTDFGRVALQLEWVALPRGLVLYERDAVIEWIYFPTTGCVSLVNSTPEGQVEVGTIGFEGFVGVPILLRADSQATEAIVQVVGEGYRISASAFLSTLAESDTLQRVLLRYALSLYNQVAQSVACNRLHALEARCARWLLITHDRVDGDEFELTQQFLSYMLGVHRPAVTIAAGQLQKARLIRYSRGKITITDRAGLEAASCSCYKTTSDDYDALCGTSS